jgi:hypothetical protein
MKKVICFVALLLASPLNFADEASVQLVLDSVHNKGFVGCDDKIKEVFSSESIQYVESKMPFFNVYQGEKKPPLSLNDEIVVIANQPQNIQYGWDAGIHSYIFRKAGKQCMMSYGINIQPSHSRNCTEFIQAQYGGVQDLVTKTESLLWVGVQGRWQKWGAEGIFMPLQGGGCQGIKIPEDRR